MHAYIDVCIFVHICMHTCIIARICTYVSIANCLCCLAIRAILQPVIEEARVMAANEDVYDDASREAAVENGIGPAAPMMVRSDMEKKERSISSRTICNVFISHSLWFA